MARCLLAAGMPFRRAFLSLALVACVAACTAPGEESAAEATTSALPGDATATFGADFKLATSGKLAVGKGLLVDFALARLPQCRGALPGGAPAWNVTGYYSENGGAARSFEVTELSADGTSRVAKQGRIPLTQGGDLAVWFQVSNRWGCSEYDSQFNQNYHFTVEGALPTAQASIVFKKDGTVDKSGELRAGGKVKIRYEQERLPNCRRTERGNPVWGITGYAKINGAEARAFDTGRPEGSDRTAIDAYVDLPASGELALWFQVASLGGCTAFDSNNGQNYRLPIAP